MNLIPLMKTIGKPIESKTQDEIRSSILTQLGIDLEGIDRLSFERFYKKLNFDVTNYQPEIPIKKEFKTVLWCLKNINDLSFNEEFYELYEILSINPQKSSLKENIDYLNNISELTKQNFLELLVALKLKDGMLVDTLQEIQDSINNDFENNIVYKISLLKTIYNLYHIEIKEYFSQRDVLFQTWVKTTGSKNLLNLKFTHETIVFGYLFSNSSNSVSPIKLIQGLSSLSSDDILALETFLMFRLYKDTVDGQKIYGNSFLNRNHIVEHFNYLDLLHRDLSDELEIDILTNSSELTDSLKSLIIWHIKYSRLSIDEKLGFLNKLGSINSYYLKDLLDSFVKYYLKEIETKYSSLESINHFKEQEQKIANEWNDLLDIISLHSEIYPKIKLKKLKAEPNGLVDGFISDLKGNGLIKNNYISKGFVNLLGLLIDRYKLNSFDELLELIRLKKVDINLLLDLGENETEFISILLLCNNISSFYEIISSSFIVFFLKELGNPGCYGTSNQKNIKTFLKLSTSIDDIKSIVNNRDLADLIKYTESSVLDYIVELYKISSVDHLRDVLSNMKFRKIVFKDWISGIEEKNLFFLIKYFKITSVEYFEMLFNFDDNSYVYNSIFFGTIKLLLEKLNITTLDEYVNVFIRFSTHKNRYNIFHKNNWTGFSYIIDKSDIKNIDELFKWMETQNGTELCL